MKTTIEIKISACYYNSGQFGSYFRVMCQDRAGNEFTFSTPFGVFLGFDPNAWVKIQANVNMATGILSRVLKVITPAKAAGLAMSWKRSKKWGYCVQAPAPDPDTWIVEIREPQPAGELVPEELTPDQVYALAYEAGMYETGFETHPNSQL